MVEGFTKVAIPVLLVPKPYRGPWQMTLGGNSAESLLVLIYVVLDYQTEDSMARLVMVVMAFSVLVLSLAGAPAPRSPAPNSKKLDRVADPSPELQTELVQFDKKYRHGNTELFAELEAKAEALAKRYPAKDDQARIWYEVAHVAGQSGIDKHADLVRKYATKCLEVSRDPLQRGRSYSYLASAVELSGTAFPEGRREAAEILLNGYFEMLVQELPEKTPELPGVEKIGGLIGNGGGLEEAQARTRHAAQMAAREEAVFVRDQIDQRETLVVQLRDLYKPDAKRHGRTEEGPEELRELASKQLTDQQANELIKKVLK